mmetsp:Transcript_29834/g.44035  ORF Transcript_29834/g.44035 Transcript_29834/m.44035 type:complete len:81 (-) Transcript_29834:265-507(-)
MESKTIVLDTPAARRGSRTFQVSSQAALETLLRRYKVDALLELNEYSCEITEFTALAEGGRYTLGDSWSVELTDFGKDRL